MDILDGVDEEVESFLSKALDGRPVWPGHPTKCHVDSCDSTTEFASFASFDRHWTSKHLPDIRLFQCPVCSYQGTRKYNTTKHIRDRHSWSELVTIVKVESNTKFCDPCGTLPYKLDLRKRHAQKRRAIVDTRLVESLVRNGQVCRDQTVSFDNDGKLKIYFKH